MKIKKKLHNELKKIANKSYRNLYGFLRSKGVSVEICDEAQDLMVRATHDLQYLYENELPKLEKVLLKIEKNAEVVAEELSNLTDWK